MAIPSFRRAAWFGVADDNSTRVAQSVAVIRHAPMLVIGNAVGAVAGVLSLYHSFPLLELLPLPIIVLALQIPLIRSAVKLRGAPLPATVSRRRIKLIIGYSAMLGLVWTGLLFFYLPRAPFPPAAFLLSGIAFLCLGAVTALSAVPTACLAYALPMMAGGLTVALLAPDPAAWAVAFMLVLMFAGQIWFLSGNWRQFKFLIDTAREKEQLAVAAQASSTAKSEFLAVVSHELRTPLNGVLGMIGLALQDTLDPVQRQRLAFADQAARDLLTLVNDILDYSKFEVGLVTIEPVDFHLGDLVQSLSELLAPRVAAQGNRLNWTIDEAVPDWLRADDGRLRQVLVNLLVNAIKFTRNGSIDVHVGWVTTDEFGILRVAVTDSGIGIPPEKFDRLFQPFSQVDSSLARAHDGMGLGLSICRRLIEAMGGEIGVSSKVGQGSTFWFTIPCAPAMPQVASDRPAMPQARPMRVLVAEDNMMNQALIREMLRMGGHYCDVVADGVEAVEMVKKLPYDLVLMDVQMPRLDGLDATRQIRALRSKAREVQIVALTANVMPAQRQACLDAGMNAFLPKPVDAAALNRLLVEVAGA